MGVLSVTIEEYEDVTGYPLTTYLSDFNTFVASDYPLVVSYYAGESARPYMPAFNTLNDLLKRAARLNEVTNSFRTALNRTDFWDLLILLDDLRGKLWTIDNSSRWQRSSITKNNFSPTQEVDHTLNALQTLERVALDTAGSDNKENDWVALALRNDLREEDYTTAGGATMKLTSEEVGPSIQVVVDNLIGQNIYGKDIDRMLQFVDDDLKLLTPPKTLKQTVDVLSQLRQGDNPEFPDDGIQTSLAVGSNFASFSYSTLFRQLYNTFQKDDTLKAFKIIKLDTKEDAIMLQFEVETRLGEILEGEITI